MKGKTKRRFFLRFRWLDSLGSCGVKANSCQKVCSFYKIFGFVWTLAIKYVTTFPAIADRRAIVWRSLKQIIRGFELQVYGKRQTSDSSWEFLQIKDEKKKQLKTILMDKKLREITNLRVEMMNSKRQVKRKLVGSRSTTTRLPFDVNMIHKPPT